jgi:general transcription factor 3C polypeptide 3 (transcription factor C subunit 4)
MMEEFKEAAEVYEHSKSNSYFYMDELTLSSVKSIDPTNNDAKMKLAEIYEIMNEPRKALELVYEGTFAFSHQPINQFNPFCSH